MKTPDSFWADPSADELVQRHKIHSGLYQEAPTTPSSQRPTLGTMKPIQDENKAVAPVQAREHIESLHQNNYTTLLYGKNNVYVQPVSICHMADFSFPRKPVHYDKVFTHWTLSNICTTVF